MVERAGELVERAARALAAADGYDSWETAHERTIGKYTALARAAIAAIEKTGQSCSVCVCLVYDLPTKRDEALK